MTGRRDNDGTAGPARPSREERLAQALRENLRRRKAQARAAGIAETPSDGAAPAGPTPGDDAAT